MRKTVKNTTKTTAAKTAAAKTVKAASEKVEKTVKEAAAKAEEVKEEVAEVVEDVVEEVKKTAPKTTKTAAAKKTVVKEEVYLQCFGKEVNKDDIMKQVKEIWTKQMKNKVGDMKSVTLYLKPEENKAYYVINGDVTGSVEL